MTEELYPIKDYEGLYSITKSGKAWSIPKGSNNNRGGMFLLPSHKEYLIVFLYKNGKRRSFKLHRLIAQTFIPNPDNKPCVNHIDTNKYNNSLENLEWVTVKENCCHASKMLLYRSDKRKLSTENILFILKNKGNYYQWELGEMFGLDRSCVCRILNRKTYKEVVA